MRQPLRLLHLFDLICSSENDSRGPAEIENAFRQQTNELVALGYRSLPGGCAPSILWLTELAFAALSFQTRSLVVSFGLCSQRYVTSSALYAKGRWTDLFTKTTLVAGSLSFTFLLSVFLSVKPRSPPSSCPPPPSPSYQPHKDTVYIQVSYYSLPLVPCSPPPSRPHHTPTPCPFTPTVPPLWAYSNEGAFPPTPFCIVTTWLMQFLQKAIIVSRRAEPHTR